MRARWQGNCLWAVVLLVLSGLCHAQSMTPENEYKRLIRVNEKIQPLGEHISLCDGSLSFEVTDVSLPGNGPVLTLSRSLNTADVSEYNAGMPFPFGDWELDIPRIETITANQSNMRIRGRRQ